MLPRPLARSLLVTTVFTAALAACSEPVAFDASTDAPFDGGDGRAEAALPDTGGDVPRLGRACTRNEQCDDSLPCTDDACGAEGRCVNVPRHERCDDRVYCNGPEQCDVSRGCVRGAPVDCNDDEVCTQDRCVEATRTCTHAPLDRDGDGDPDDHCAARACGDGGVPEMDSGVVGTCWRGRDCDDRDPNVSSRARELCGDMVDNNCNGAVDSAEPGGCMTAPYDRCDAPLDVSAGGSFRIGLAGAGRDYTLRCAGGLPRDVVARLRLTAASNVTIEATSTGAALGVELKRDCASTMVADSIACDFSGTPYIRRYNLAPGDYFIVIASTGTAPVDLDVRLMPGTPAPTNDTCATATRLPGPGTWPASTAGLRSTYNLSCNPGTRPTAVFEFTTTATQDVTVSSSFAGFDTAIALVDRCEPPPVNELRCGRGGFTAPPSVRARSLPAGTYRAIVQTGTRGVDFNFTLALDPPTVAPPEDACPAGGATMPAIELADGMPHVARLSSLDDDYLLSCNSFPFRPARDGVFRLTLAAPSDVRVDATATTGETFISFRNSPCGVGTSEVRCAESGFDSSAASVARRNLPAGTYWVIVENESNDDVTVRATIVSPPAPTVDYTLSTAPAGVSFVDVCAMPGAGRVLATVDDSTAQIPMAASGITIPFPLRMYGVDVTPPIAVSSNGWLSLTRTGVVSLTGMIPAPADPNLTIAPLWTDLFTRADGVCYAVTGTAPNRAFVVQWNDLHECCGAMPGTHFTFQAIVREPASAGANNVIDVVYQRIEGLTRTPAAGIENDDGTLGIAIAPPFTAPRVVRFTPSR